MPAQVIKISGARQHNLKNLYVEIPRDKLAVITGLRRWGKSSLAFDTLHAEGQRRYVEGLSAYARQFLDTRNQRLKRALLYDRYLTQQLTANGTSMSKSKPRMGSKKQTWPYIRFSERENSWMVDARTKDGGSRKFFGTKVEAQTYAQQGRIQKNNL